MPSEEIGAGFESWGRWHPDSLAVENPVFLTVVEFFPYSITDFEVMILGHRNITGVEEPVDV
jgi:hypothetical protein